MDEAARWGLKLSDNEDVLLFESDVGMDEAARWGLKPHDGPDTNVQAVLLLEWMRRPVGV